MKNPNHLPVPPGQSSAFGAGWRACEAGKTLADNPYKPPTIIDRPGARFHEWVRGFGGRQDLP